MSSSDSASDSSQTQIQDTQDNRISSAEGSVNLVTSRSSVGGDVNIMQTDFGTVGRSFDFAEKIAVGAAQTAAASGAQVAKIATSSMQSVQAAYQDVNDNLAAAYETSKAGEQKMMVAAALAVVGLVAVRALGKGA